MSRIGRKPVPLPAGVKATVTGRDIVIEGNAKQLNYTFRPEVSVEVDTQANQLVVQRRAEDRVSKAMHGLTRALLANMVVGVTKGFSRELEINGVGWTAKLQGQQVALNVGYADTRYVSVSAGLTVDIKGNRITISGADKQAVGQLAARIRSQRPPEPYNGKGIKYADERIVRKAGKAFGSGG